MAFRIIRQIPEDSFEQRELEKFETLERLKRDVISLLQRTDLSTEQKLLELNQ